MREIVTKIYRFEELSEKAQSHALEKYRDIFVSDSFWYEDLLEEYKACLEKCGFYDAEILFSGFFSQGDGACFDAQHIDVAEVLNAIIMTDRACIDREFIRFYTLANHDAIECDILQTTSRYVHAYTRYIGADSPFLTEMETKRLEEIIENFRLNLCYTIYNRLEAEYQYQTSDEVLREFFIETECEFYENGKMV